MKLYEKLAFKLGTKVGSAIYGKNLTPEQKRQLERQAYQDMLAEERMKASSSRSSGGSGYQMQECCCNCFYFNDFMGEYCTKHQYAFTTSEEVNNVKYKRRCSEYRRN